MALPGRTYVLALSGVLLGSTACPLGYLPVAHEDAVSTGTLPSGDGDTADDAPVNPTEPAEGTSGPGSEPPDSGTGAVYMPGDETTGVATAGGATSGEDSGQDPTTGVADASFMLGADISSVHERDDLFRDTDGQIKSIFALLQNHGFNYIRVKTFVDPGAPYGYASSENGCAGLSEPFSDRDHVVAFGKEIKDAGMGFLLNFHYSDVWADPGNQIIPLAWRDSATIEELAAHVSDYTTDVLQTAIAAGARPDMVQIGNEITPGMLVHVPGPDTDCWGNNPVSAPVGGSSSPDNWDNLATLLDAGIQAVRDVDPTIKIMLHLENTSYVDGVRWWVDHARSRGVQFDVLGLSCYTAWQGEPAVWKNTFESLAQDYPELEFAIAEYNPERTEANLMIRNLPGGRGLGTFFWEPTRSGSWGSSMFTWKDGVYVANEVDFAEFDAMLPKLGL